MLIHHIYHIYQICIQYFIESSTIKELPAFDSAKSILRGWFRSVKR